MAFVVSASGILAFILAGSSFSLSGSILAAAVQRPYWLRERRRQTMRPKYRDLTQLTISGSFAVFWSLIGYRLFSLSELGHPTLLLLSSAGVLLGMIFGIIVSLALSAARNRYRIHA